MQVGYEEKTRIGYQPGIIATPQKEGGETLDSQNPIQVPGKGGHKHAVIDALLRCDECCHMYYKSSCSTSCHSRMSCKVISDHGKKKRNIHSSHKRMLQEKKNTSRQDKKPGR